MRTIIAAFILLCFSLFSSGQGSKVAHVIKGKVINAETNQPVSYTNIGLEGTLYGTASNDEGDFELKIPENLVSKNIYFSAVGFQNRQFPVQELFDKDFNVVKLQSQSYDVDKIDVEGQNMVLIRILRMASENIRYNNGSGPFNLHCSYTKATTINDSIKTNTSANVLIYDNTGYSKPSPVDAYKSRFYKVSSTDHNYSFSSNLLKIDELLSLDLVRSASGILNPGILIDYNLKLGSQP